jgi:hypothetical protein
MGDKKGYSFDLHEEMLSLIEKEFSPREIAAGLAQAVEGKAAAEIPEVGKKIFDDYGKRWAARVIDLGESYMDRTYEVLREEIDGTGSPAFPLIPQRFVEIAYLSTQRISTLPIVENNIAGLIFRIKNCRTYEAISEKLGQETAGLLVCRQGCLNLCQGIVDGLGIKGIKTEMSATIPEKGYCQFILKNTKAAAV